MKEEEFNLLMSKKSIYVADTEFLYALVIDIHKTLKEIKKELIERGQY